MGMLLDKLLDLEPPQDTPTDEDIHYWTHGDDKEDAAIVHTMLEVKEDPYEAVKQCLHCGGAYVKEIIKN